MPTPKKIERDAEGIPTRWVVWIDDNMGYSAPNWEIDKPGDHPEETAEAALKHAAEVLARGYPVAIRPVGSPPAAMPFEAAKRPLAGKRYTPERTQSATGHKSVLIYGPQGSRKTLHAEELRKHFGLAAVLDDWTPGDPWPITGHLVLTHYTPSPGTRRALPITTALTMLRRNAPGYPF
jgi:hypothetical protein